MFKLNNFFFFDSIDKDVGKKPFKEMVEKGENAFKRFHLLSQCFLSYAEQICHLKHLSRRTDLKYCCLVKGIMCCVQNAVNMGISV